ncbi:unnamed protein product [Anisakis simplex]|uniref:FAD assembly factor SdhE n=1 Tax=Anisakis simplex TaxID=6269 RepID=A0A0M3JDE9_ANISI|nr:unnamed protein product [Anisakis simplex]
MLPMTQSVRGALFRSGRNAFRAPRRESLLRRFEDDEVENQMQVCSNTRNIKIFLLNALILERKNVIEFFESLQSDFQELSRSNNYLRCSAPCSTLTDS